MGKEDLVSVPEIPRLNMKTKEKVKWNMCSNAHDVMLPEQMTDVITELFWPGIFSLILPVVGAGITTTTTENGGKPGDGSSGCKQKT